MNGGGPATSPWVCWAVVLLLGVIAWGSSGCATGDGDSGSERPWNAPQGWENGLPPQMYERR
jgi:hypothetical protein